MGLASQTASLPNRKPGSELASSRRSRNSLTRSLTPNANAGFLEVLYGGVLLNEVLWTNSSAKFSFLPAVVTSRLAQSSEILASGATRKVFETLRGEKLLAAGWDGKVE
jgi:hypothetical protein